MRKSSGVLYYKSLDVFLSNRKLRNNYYQSFSYYIVQRVIALLRSRHYRARVCVCVFFFIVSPSFFFCFCFLSFEIIFKMHRSTRTCLCLFRTRSILRTILEHFERRYIAYSGIIFRIESGFKVCVYYSYKWELRCL